MSEQRVGPKVRVRIEYECNGCQYHKIDADTENGCKYHACHHPSVIASHGCPQWQGGGSPDLTLWHIAKAPSYLCPYIEQS